MSELVDPFEEYDPSQRESIRALFSPAFYNRTCDQTSRTIIEPVYYWPGDNVQLKCVVCSQEFAINNVSKSWAIFQRNIPESILDLYKTLSIDKYGNEQWLVLDQHGADIVRDKNTTISFIPGGEFDPNNVTSQ